MAWSHEQAKRLRELSLEVSVREAARIMAAEGYRVTPSSALGYIHRNRVDFPHVTPRGDGIARKTADSRRSQGMKAKRVSRKSKGVTRPNAPEKRATPLPADGGVASVKSDSLPVGKRVVIAADLDPDPTTARDLEAHDCRWPIGDPRQPLAFSFCGRRKVVGASYCADHLRRMTETPEQTKERLAEWKALQIARQKEAA